MQTPATGECGELCRGLLIAAFPGLLGTVNIAVVVAVCVVLWYRKLNQVTVLALVSDGIASLMRAVFLFMNPLLWNTPSFEITGVLWIAAIPFSVSSLILVARYLDESSSQTLGEASDNYAHRTRWRKRLLFQASIPIVFVMIQVTASLDAAGKAVLYAKYLSAIVLWLILSILMVLHVVNIRRVSRALRLSRSRPVAMAFVRRFIIYVMVFAFGIVVFVVSRALTVTPFFLSPLGFSVTTFLMSFVFAVMAVSNVVMIRKGALLPLEVEQEVHPFAVANRVSTTLANQGKLSGSVVDRTKSVSANNVLAKRVEKRSDGGSILTVAFEDESFLDPGSRTETPTTGWMPRNVKRQSSESPPLFGNPEVLPKKGALQASVNADIRGRILLCEDQNVVANIIIGALNYYRPNVVVDRAENGQEALDLILRRGSARKEDGRIDEEGYRMVISDIDMPIMTGVEFCTAVRKDLSRQLLPILAHSANPQYDTKCCKEAGFNGRLLKPAANHRLLSMVDRLGFGSEYIPTAAGNSSWTLTQPGISRRTRRSSMEANPKAVEKEEGKRTRRASLGSSSKEASSPISTTLGTGIKHSTSPTMSLATVVKPSRVTSFSLGNLVGGAVSPPVMSLGVRTKLRARSSTDEKEFISPGTVPMDGSPGTVSKIFELI